MRLVDDARAAELGNSPDDAARGYRDAFALLGDSYTSVHADVLRWHGTLLRDRGRTTEAEHRYRRSLEIARSVGYQAGIAHALNCMAGVDQRRGDLRHAARLLADAALIADAQGDTRLLTMIHSNLGILADVRGDIDGAIDALSCRAAGLGDGGRRARGVVGPDQLWGHARPAREAG